MTTARQPVASTGRAALRAGFVLGPVLSVVLLFVIVVEVVYLATHYRVRFDLTEDQTFSLTDSTARVLERLDKKLLIECYFSPDSELPAQALEMRRTVRKMLDEFAQNSDERIVVQYFDPQSDVAIKQRATRLGIQGQRVADVQGTTLANKEIWQGLRFRYGGEKQKVVPFLSFYDRPAWYEATITPIIKGLTVTQKPKIGVVAWPALPPQRQGFGGGGEPGKGFDRILQAEAITDRYEIVRVSIDAGQLIPAELETLILIRPKDLDDRQKYAIDQFLMRGGELCVFADTDDVSLGQARLLTTREVAYDAAKSEVRFLEQLAHYGATVGTKMLLDRHEQAQHPFHFVVAYGGGMRFPQQLPRPGYPYWFRPLQVDWSERADEFARGADGVDDELAAQYRRNFRPGVDKERAEGLTVPAFFWPVAVDVAQPLPERVTGHVLFRTSPRAFEDTPPRDVHPVGPGQNMQGTFRAFCARLDGLEKGEPLRQFGLMVDLRGSFPSFFEGKKIPAAPHADAATNGGEKTDPLEGPVVPDEGDGKDQDTAEGPGIEERDAPEAGVAEKDPDPIFRARPGARLLVVGDTDFLRDDIVAGELRNVGGPVQNAGFYFFVNLLDWLAEDADLFALRGKTATDRTQRFFTEEDREGLADPQRLNQAVRDEAFWVQVANVAAPPLLLTAFGLIVWIQRRTRKKAFLTRTQS